MRVVSVDDNANNLLLIEAYCKQMGLSVKSFLQPAEALMHLHDEVADLVITDYMMPDMNGIELTQEIRKFDKTLPVVMVTAVGRDEAVHTDALEAGANDFLLKPINAAQFQARVGNLLKLRKSELLVKDRAALLENEVAKATQKLIDREHETLMLLGKTAEYRDPETAAHVQRVAHYSRMLARLKGLSEHQQDIILYASPFHDIGKVSTPDAVLLKPGKLTDEEYEIMKQHAYAGYELLRNATSDYLKAGSIIALTHHEKFDGTGYPKGLKGTMIPLMGRIVAVVDVFDALTSSRPYKKAWPLEDAFAFLQDQAGKHFDPELVELFVGAKKEVLEIFHRYQEGDA